MPTKNEDCTRYYSDKHEKSVCLALDARQTANSGAGNFTKGDVIQSNSSMLIECKTCMEDKKSFSIKEDWLTKNKLEAFEMRLDNNCLAFNFGPRKPNYYVIDEKLMKFLVEKLIEERETY